VYVSVYVSVYVYVCVYVCVYLYMSRDAAAAASSRIKRLPRTITCGGW